MTGDGVDQEQPVVVGAAVRIEEQVSIAGQESAVAEICAKEYFKVVSHGEAKVRAGTDLEHLIPIVVRLLEMSALGGQDVRRVGNIVERIEGLLSEASGKLIDGNLGCAGLPILEIVLPSKHWSCRPFSRVEIQK